jgi:hypothetical protein
VRGHQLLTIKNQFVMKCYTGPWVGSCKHSNELSGSIKYGEFIDYLINYLCPKRDSAPWS